MIYDIHIHMYVYIYIYNHNNVLGLCRQSRQRQLSHAKGETIGIIVFVLRPVRLLRDWIPEGLTLNSQGWEFSCPLNFIRSLPESLTQGLLVGQLLIGGLGVSIIIVISRKTTTTIIMIMHTHTKLVILCIVIQHIIT